MAHDEHPLVTRPDPTRVTNPLVVETSGATVETGIGNFKKNSSPLLPPPPEGLAAVTSEIHLAATAFNLLKIHRAADK
ncbi:MAG: hypothetical protein M3Y48_23735 [Actinomycetota bacterium]|nr:hypothetical protein [Actinomycetota bacterium]